MGDALQTIRAVIKEQQSMAIQLEMRYRVLYSTLQGNMPVNDRVYGSVIDIPIDLKLEHTLYPNTYGTYPVNSRFHGFVGDTPLEGELPYKMVYSTIAGNYPVNTGVKITLHGTSYHLRMLYTLALGKAQGGGVSAGGGTAGKKKKFEPKFVRGKLVDTDDDNAGGGDSMMFEAGRPIPYAIQGVIEDIRFDLRFNRTYYTNTNSGRNPINTRLIGSLHYVPSSP